MGYPAAYLDVRDHRSFCFTQAFQSIGLGLATAIGAAVASPGRLTVAALGDGGALMSSMELETVVRTGARPARGGLRRPRVRRGGASTSVPTARPLDTVVFPDTDIAAIGRGFGFDAVTCERPGPGRRTRWLDAAGRARCWWTRRWPTSSRRGGSRRRSGATDRRCQDEAMDLDTFRWLLTDDGQSLLAAATAAEGTPFQVQKRLREVSTGSTDEKAERVAAALGQVELRRRAAAKLGDDAARMYFTRDGLEQATRARVARTGRPAWRSADPASWT
jgi:hypothetical protein